MMADEAQPIRAQSADGVTHEFPAGTDQAIVDKAMKEYAQKSAKQLLDAAPTSIAAGFMDPIQGGAELLEQITPEPVRNTINTFNNWLAKHTGLVAELPPGGVAQQTRQREEQIQRARGMNKDRLDWARLGGDLLNPANYVGGGFIGGAGKVANIARAGVGGLTASALSPVTDPNYWREKGKQLTLGTAFGLTAGAAASAVGKGLDAVGAYLASKNPELLENNAVKLILKRIAQDEKAGGPTATDMLDLVNATDKPATLVDFAGPNVKGLAGRVARQPGESKAIAQSLIGARDQRAAQRIREDIETYMHGGDSAYQTQEMLLNARSAAAKPLYDEAFALKNIWSPRLQNFIDDPDFKQGLNRGWHLERLRALAEGRKITATELGVDVDMEGNIVMKEVPNMRLLDMAKRGVDAMIADERDAITGRLSARGVALDNARRAFIKEIEDTDKSGVYKRARAAWEGPSASRDAVTLGRSVFQTNPEAMAAEIDKLSPANREFGRIGVADIMKERLAKTGLHGDEAKAIIRNPWMRDQLKPWFRSTEDFDKFVDAVTTETKMFETGAKLVGNSATGERLAEDVAGEGVEQALQGAHVVGQLASGHPLRAALNAWRLYRDLGLKPDPKFNEKVAQILFATNISPELEAKLSGKVPLDTVNPLERAGQRASAAGVTGGTMTGVQQPEDRGTLH